MRAKSSSQLRRLPPFNTLTVVHHQKMAWCYRVAKHTGLGNAMTVTHKGKLFWLDFVVFSSLEKICNYEKACIPDSTWQGLPLSCGARYMFHKRHCIMVSVLGGQIRLETAVKMLPDGQQILSSNFWTQDTVILRAWSKMSQRQRLFCSLQSPNFRAKCCCLLSGKIDETRGFNASWRHDPSTNLWESPSGLLQVT